MSYSDEAITVEFDLGDRKFSAVRHLREHTVSVRELVGGAPRVVITAAWDPDTKKVVEVVPKYGWHGDRNAVAAAATTAFRAHW